MILSVAALRIKMTIVSVDMPHLLSKWLENKATNLVSRILKMRIPHLQSFVFLYFPVLYFCTLPFDWTVHINFHAKY